MDDIFDLIILMTNTDPYVLVWPGKFIHQIFIKRNEIIHKFIE